MNITTQILRAADALARRTAIEHMEWLASQCGVCVLDGFGPECDMHGIEHDALMRRAEDV